MRLRFVIACALVALAALIAGIAAAGARSATPLPSLSAAEVMARMGEQTAQVPAVSGDISWRNGLFGADMVSDALGATAAQSPLLASGSGRVWASAAGLRVESQGGAGDQVLVVDAAGREVWVYEAAASTAQHYVAAGSASASPSPRSSRGALTPQAIARALQRLAPLATVDIAGQGVVAGRDVYLLRMTPAADDTVLGEVEVAVDGETFLPLRVQVFARGATDPVLRADFDRVSYGQIDPERFAFTPPAGTAVTTEELSAGEGDEMRQDGLSRTAPLTLAEVEQLVDYPVVTAPDKGQRPFRGGYVFKGAAPLDALGVGVAPKDAWGRPAQTVSLLIYGDGFGAIGLFQTKTTPEIKAAVERLTVISGTATVGGASARIIVTPLGAACIWESGDTTVVAAGLVSQTDLQAFAESVQ